MIRIQWALVMGMALVMGCVEPTFDSRVGSTTALLGRRDAAAAAVTALQEGRFDDAGRLSAEGVSADGGNPYARLVSGIVRYKKSMHQLALDGMTLVGGLESGAINQKYLRSTLGDAESDLAAVEADLAIVAQSRGINVDLCIACWKIDWNGNGRVDQRDSHLMEIEEDAEGAEVPEDDPRRKPTFHFDDGDVAWARAFVAFQRAALDVLLAYDWTEVALIAARRSERPDQIVIHLTDPGRIDAARERFLEGLVQSETSRRQYLAETDDDREWLPNPRQKDHPMPLPVDQALYDTWEGVVGDLERLAKGEEGLSVAQVMTLAGEHTKVMPKGYLDIGRMLSHPKDIVLDMGDLEDLDRKGDIEGAMKSILGEYYVGSMKPSPLPKRLLRMKGELDKGDRELERKLRYLFWVN